MIIKNVEDLVSVLTFIETNKVIAYDIETTGLNKRKDKIIGIGISNADKGFYIPTKYFNTESIIDLLSALSKKDLLMFNASFDATFTYNKYGIDLLPQLHTDVLLLKHTCDEEFPFGLKEIAKKLFGHDVTKEKDEMKASIKANGGKPTEFYKADENLLGKYCIQDCLLTFKLYNHYLPLLKRQGSYNFFYNEEVMPLYKLVTIPMERVGVKLDVAKIQQYLFEIEQDIANLENSIQEAIKPNLGIFTTWFLNKEYPLKTATGKIPKNIQKYGSQEEAWKAENDGYMFNLESKHHLKKLFFETLNAQPINSTEKGNPQVDEEFLEHMAQKYTWAQDLIYYNKLNKVKSTYYSRLLDEVEDGIFYPSFQQHRTISGRYASDLQQLPRPLESGHPLLIKYTNVIREFILPKQDKLISADYEQLEPTTFAHVSGDKGLQNIFNSNLDFYSEIAIRTERLKDVSSDKKAENYLGKLNKSLRQKAKAYSLGIAYGMTDYKLGLDLGIEQKEAERLINDYFRAFPDLHKWIVKSHDTAITYGAIKCQSGRIRHLEDARRIYSSYGASIKNSLTLYSLYGQNHEVYAKVKEDRKIFKNLLNNAVNFQIQGLAASIVNRAAIAIVKLFAQLGIKAHIIAQIHDELVFDVSEKDCQKACEIIKNCMQNSEFNLSVPLRTEPQIGNNFKECK